MNSIMKMAFFGHWMIKIILIIRKIPGKLFVKVRQSISKVKIKIIHKSIRTD
jgi:hypothetical protein